MLRKLAFGLFAIGVLTPVMAQPTAAFDTTSLSDWYAFRFSGMTGGNAVVGGGVMRFLLDVAGDPKMTGRATLHGYNPGGGCPGSIQAGLYTINADGTGFVSSDFIPDHCLNGAGQWPASVLREYHRLLPLAAGRRGPG